MNLFFDTSALVKLFHQESGSAAIAALVELDDAVIWVSELARVEFVNALHRRVRMHELDEAQMEEALLGFAEAWETFRVEPLGTGVLREAELFIKNMAKHMA